jgi:UDP-N-acetylglucosamine 2-epimerase (non-hydrolysing)
VHPRTPDAREDAALDDISHGGDLGVAEGAAGGVLIGWDRVASNFTHRRNMLLPATGDKRAELGQTIHRRARRSGQASWSENRPAYGQTGREFAVSAGQLRAAVVFGTRPEIIKLARIARLLGPDSCLIHSGQHDSYEMAKSFLDELRFGAPDVQLAVGNQSRGQQIGEAIRGLDEYFEADRPDVVVVQGDTNTTLAGAVAANARQIPIVHIEAGLRSRDRAMPEEHNRVVTDHLADVCCAPTDVSKMNLEHEGVGGERVVVTGNTVVDAVLECLPSRVDRRSLVAKRGVDPGSYILATFHRPENVDEPAPLRTVLDQLGALPMPVILPLHPRTADRARAFGLSGQLSRLIVTEPLGYSEFVALAAESAVLVSDSGGLVEEASVLKRPIAVVRRSTERPEVQGTFAELVASGPAISKQVGVWLDDVEAVHARLAEISSPYGDGRASERCVAAIRRALARTG